MTRIQPRCFRPRIRAQKTICNIAALTVFFLLSTVSISATTHGASELYRKLWSDPALQQTIDRNIEQYRKSDVVLEISGPDGRPLSEIPVRIDQTSHEFLFGSNLFVLGQLPTPEANRKYEEAFLRLFNFASVPFYWAAIEPVQGTLRYSDGVTTDIWRRPPPDRLVQWCRKHGVVPKGHPLLWHEHNPSWLPHDAEALRNLYVKRFTEIAGRYGDSIPIWDCVNEPTICVKHYPLYSEDRSYVAWAFNTARQLFPPKTILLINETPDAAYEYLGPDGARTRYYKTIEQLLEKKTPIDAIGFQLHIMSDSAATSTLAGKLFTPEQMLKVHNLYDRFGLPQYVTEITIPTLGEDVAMAREAQAEMVRNFYRLWFSVPRMAGITWWNLGDGTAISHEDRWHGGLLDKDFNPKPSYQALDQLINHDWKTQCEGTTDARGRFEFRGFHGNYRVTLRIAGTPRTFDITVKKGVDNRFKLSPSQ